MIPGKITLAPPSGRFKVAMIGAGDITPLHFVAYNNFEHAELVAICDLDKNILDSRSAEWGVRATDDYREILDDPEIDIVEVNTPHHLHRKFVVKALDAGKHVACQKPMGSTLFDSRAIIEARDRNLGRLRILENFIFYPPYIKARELVEAGEIGEPLTIRFKLGTGLFGSRLVPLRSELWHLLESEKGLGQAVFDDGFHKLSTAVFFFGRIESVTGFIDRSFSFIDEPAQLIWRYKDSPILGSFDLAFSPNLYTYSKYFPADERIDIIGTEGIINLTRCTAKLLDAPPLILYRNGKRFLFDSLEADWQAGFTAGIRDFPFAIKENRDCLLSAEQTDEIKKFALALIIAAKKGVDVRPDEVTDEQFAMEFS